MERLQKIIARAGVTSRRNAEKLIVEGRVTVDGKIITELGAQADYQKSKICVDGKILTFDVEKIYILLNKPRGYVCTAKDERGRKTVLDLINIEERIYPVGRLDLNSEGLLLLTNDGDLMNALIHPKFKIDKTYRVKISGDVTEEKLDKLRAGIELDDGLTAPAEIFLLEKDLVCCLRGCSLYEDGRSCRCGRFAAQISRSPLFRLSRYNALLFLHGAEVEGYADIQDQYPHGFQLVELLCRHFRVRL